MKGEKEGERSNQINRDKRENKTQPQKIVINILGEITEDTVSIYQESLTQKGTIRD